MQLGKHQKEVVERVRNGTPLFFERVNQRFVAWYVGKFGEQQEADSETVLRLIERGALRHKGRMPTLHPESPLQLELGKNV